MIPKPFDQIGKEDIEDLVARGVGESRTLEYKQELHNEKREFLYDISAFANTAGGDMIVGITEKRDESGQPTSLPASAEGVALPNLSKTMTAFENSLMDGVDPRIPGFQWKPIPGFPKGSVIVIRVPKSWIGPHMVTVDRVSRFYSRNSNGKYQLDVREIRSAFSASSVFAATLRHFRLERTAKASEDDLPVSLGNGPKLLMHLVPMSALDPINLHDYTYEATKLSHKLEPLTAVGLHVQHQRRYNLDGMFTRMEFSTSYLQVFRSGIIECGDSDLFKYTAEYKGIPRHLEDTLLKGVQHYLRSQEAIGISLPIFVMVTLLGVKGFEMNSRQALFLGQRGIDREIVPLPEALIESYDDDVASAVRLTFDALWQACGHEKSLNYTDQGEWNPQSA